jgi:hypothetical protein
MFSLSLNIYLDTDPEIVALGFFKSFSEQTENDTGESRHTCNSNFAKSLTYGRNRDSTMLLKLMRLITLSVKRYRRVQEKCE